MPRFNKVVITVSPEGTRNEFDGETWVDYPVFVEIDGRRTEPRKFETALTGPHAGTWGHEWSWDKPFESRAACIEDYVAKYKEVAKVVEVIAS